jgi:hypothetical protein
VGGAVSPPPGERPRFVIVTNLVLVPLLHLGASPCRSRKLPWMTIRRLVSMEPTESIVETIRVESAEPIVVPDYADGTPHSISQLALPIIMTNSIQLLALSLPFVPAAALPTPAILCGCHGSIDETRGAGDSGRDGAGYKKFLQTHNSSLFESPWPALMQRPA